MSRQPSHAVRENILSAALRIFGDKGYKEATIREIARLADIAVGGIYPYFGNKEQLYMEVLLEEGKEYKEGIRELENEDPEAAVRRYIENHLKYIISKRQVISRHFKDYDLEFAKPFRAQFFAYQKNLLETIIRRGAEQRVFLRVDCQNAALFILCVLKGANFSDLAGMIDLTKSGDTLCQLVLNFLKQEEITGELAIAPHE